MPRKPSQSKNWGGKRPGQGRPKKVRNFSEEIKQDVVKALKRKAKEDGVTFGDLLVKSAWGDGHFALKATAMKLIAEILVVKESKSTVEKVDKPQIFLPELPAKPTKTKEIEQEVRMH